jgi:polyhydroxybutyrate depolymerase
MLFIVTLLVVLAGCGRLAARGDINDSIQVGGIKRTFHLHVPSTYTTNQPTSLVLAFHGGGGSGAGMPGLTGLDAVADENKFIAVYPDGIEKHWNDGRVENPQVDDVAFISALIDTLAQQYNIDPHRVYAMGISNGAIFSNKLACALSDKIAAIGAVAGTLAANDDAHCTPKEIVSVIAFHGTADPLVPFDGGAVKGGLAGDVLGARETAAHWASLNGCAANPSVSDMPDADPRDGTTAQRYEYGGCRNGSAVTLYVIRNGGHTWPGGLQYLPAALIGKTSRDVNATQTMWQFFQQHSK